ncbi:hypothetical protein DOY81_003775 [Sarcophaga bullata]|nr:hypothetical protein DOY81_003775 [Sarcophaga bullata]
MGQRPLGLLKENNNKKKTAKLHNKIQHTVNKKKMKYPPPNNLYYKLNK